TGAQGRPVSVRIEVTLVRHRHLLVRYSQTWVAPRFRIALMNVLVLDNCDSFTWNLVQALESLEAHCIVERSDRIALEDVKKLRPARIVLSPGPFGPERTGICREVVGAFSGKLPLLGICLGMQVIAVAAGAEVRPSG